MENNQKTDPDLSRISLNLVPVRIESLKIIGNNKTDPQFIQFFTSSLYSSKNFKELCENAILTKTRLEMTECFKEVDVFFDLTKDENELKSLDFNNNNQELSSVPIKVKIMVSELGRIKGGIKTSYGVDAESQRPNCILEGLLPNLAGKGERLSFETLFDLSSLSNSSLTFSRPLTQLGNIFFSEASASVYKGHSKNPLVGFNLNTLGTNININIHNSLNMKNKMSWEGNWREIFPISNAVPFEVMEDCGHSFKSALKHNFLMDFKNQNIFPSKGFKINLSQEIAGFGGDVSFFKHQSEFKHYFALPLKMTFESTFRFGFMTSPFSRNKIGIVDKFHLGGASGIEALRGFDTKGLESRQNFGSFSLGGQAYWSGGLSLYCPLLGLSSNFVTENVRTHFFINAGNLKNSSSTSSFFGSFLPNSKDLRLSVGAGLALQIALGLKLELNYCLPLKYKYFDRIKHGWQLGIGLDFL